MKSLIIIAHGSKVKQSNDEIINISENISNIIDKSTYDKVEYAFLELTTPSLEDTLAKCIENNSTQITIFPYFLAAGKHVKADIPEIVEVFKDKYSNIEFKVLPHFGKCKGIEDLILANS